MELRGKQIINIDVYIIYNESILFFLKNAVSILKKDDASNCIKHTLMNKVSVGIGSRPPRPCKKINTFFNKYMYECAFLESANVQLLHQRPTDVVQ